MYAAQEEMAIRMRPKVRQKHPSPTTLRARERRRRKAFGLPLGKPGRPRHAKPSKAALYQRARRQRLRAKS